MARFEVILYEINRCPVTLAAAYNNDTKSYDVMLTLQSYNSCVQTDKIPPDGILNVVNENFRFVKNDCTVIHSVPFGFRMSENKFLVIVGNGKINFVSEIEYDTSKFDKTFTNWSKFIDTRTKIGNHQTLDFFNQVPNYSKSEGGAFTFCREVNGPFQFRCNVDSASFILNVRIEGFVKIIDETKESKFHWKLQSETKRDFILRGYSPVEPGEPMTKMILSTSTERISKGDILSFWGSPENCDFEAREVILMFRSKPATQTQRARPYIVLEQNIGEDMYPLHGIVQGVFATLAEAQKWSAYHVDTLWKTNPRCGEPIRVVEGFHVQGIDLVPTELEEKTTVWECRNLRKRLVIRNINMSPAPGEKTYFFHIENK
jgi:hypothetical protein